MLLVTMHHIVSDGWSVGVFVDELAALYQAFFDGSAARLPGPTLQYADYAVAHLFSAESSPEDRQFVYWKRKLANLRRFDVPTDRTRPLIQTFNGDIASILLPRKLTNELGAYGAKRGVTLFMIAYAALATHAASAHP